MHTRAQVTIQNRYLLLCTAVLMTGRPNLKVPLAKPRLSFLFQPKAKNIGAFLRGDYTVLLIVLAINSSSSTINSSLRRIL